MVEAQFYPGDFKGIVAGAPAFNWPAIGAKFVEECQKNYPDSKDLSKYVITADNLKLLQDNVLKQCDNLDGLKDGIIADPRNCNFDVSKLTLCPGDKAGAGCLSWQQLVAIKAVYDPVMLEGKMIYPGFPVGLENVQGSWDTWISGTGMGGQEPSLHYAFGTEMFKYLVYNDPSWTTANMILRTSLRKPGTLLPIWMQHKRTTAISRSTMER